MPALSTLAANCEGLRLSKLPGIRLTFVLAVVPFGISSASENRSDQVPSPTFVSELMAPESEVLQAVREVVDDHIIHGTRVFEHEPTLTGAEEASSTPLFLRWQGGGKVFYKVRTEVIAPRHFR